MADPALLSAVGQQGGGALQDVGGFFMALEEQKRQGKIDERTERFLEMLRGRFGQEVISKQRQRDLAFQSERAGEPDRRRFAEIINERLGLDAGAAQGELLRFQTEQGQTFRSQLALEAERLKASADQRNLGLQASLVRG